MTAAAEGPGSGRPVVGVVGLGIMGGAMARHLLAAGYEVVGHDVALATATAFTEAGGTSLADAAAVAGASDVVILSLPSVAAFEAVVGGPGGLSSAPSPRARAIADTSTMPLDLKLATHEQLAGNGLEFLDCPISGTGAQMAVKDTVFYTSGDAAALSLAEPVLADCGKGVFNLGALGNGTRLKLVANHLVTIHNASAAEAISLARHGGIDPAVALEALVAGAGTSRMLELRGQMMVDQVYEPATMKGEVFMKDVEIITGFARKAGVPLPVFAAAAQLHLAAVSCGWGSADTAAVHAVIERLSGA
ncbi:MAG: NAD(P)-dependent oxidoreductase [Acidimicrobiales bacterium]